MPSRMSGRSALQVTSKRLGCLGFGLALLSLAARAQETGRPIVVRRPPGDAPLPATAGAAAKPPSQPIVVRRAPSQPSEAGPTSPTEAVTPSDTQPVQTPIVVRKNPDQPMVSVPDHLTDLASDTSAISAVRALLDQQTAEWNRGDLDAFARGYKQSPDILFLSGSNIQRGYDSMLQRYKKGYPTRERMGTLSFSQLEVQPLSADFATTTGHFHLQRSAAGGGNADGSFLLVLEKTTEGWKIVRDDTTASPVKSR